MGEGDGVRQTGVCGSFQNNYNFRRFSRFTEKSRLWVVQNLSWVASVDCQNFEMGAKGGTLGENELKFLIRLKIEGKSYILKNV